MEIAAVQKMLATKAHYQPTHRFNDLYRFVRDRNWLESARNAVLHNTGANTPGVDGVHGKSLSTHDWQTLLNQTVEELRDGTYQPQPVRRVYIPKANGKLRPLGIPIIRDRVVQEVLRMTLEPIYESLFLDCSYGFRPGRSTMAAIDAIWLYSNASCKYWWFVEGDIQGCFDAIPHDRLIRVLRRTITDERLLDLIWAFLKAGHVEHNQLHKTNAGTPQGGVVSPLLANIYLHQMDLAWWERYGNATPYERDKRRKAGLGNVRLIRYADDFLVLTNGDKAEALALREEFGAILTQLGLTLSPEKTLVTHVDDGLEFLGFHIQRKPRPAQPQRKVVYVEPTERSQQRYKDKLRALLKDTGGDVVNKLRALNPVILGWARYYQYVNAAKIRGQLDYWTFWAVWRWLERKHGGYWTQKEIYHQYVLPSPKGQRTLGYKRVYLASMEAEVPLRDYRCPKGGYQNPYLAENSDLSIVGDEPIAEVTWNGISAQNRYAIARQDLLAQNGPICQMCGQQFPEEELDAHHKMAQSEGGKHGISNLELRCRKCHAQTESYGRTARRYDGAPDVVKATRPVRGREKAPPSKAVC